MSDPATYRSKEEVEFWKSRDPIPKLKEAIKGDFEIGDEEFEEIDKRVEDAVAKAVAVAEAGEELPPERLCEDLRTLRPWDKDIVVESVTKTHHAVTVEECPPVCGIGAELAANIYELAFDEMDAPVERVSGADVPLPYARNLEQFCIPHAENVAEAARKTLAK